MLFVVESVPEREVLAVVVHEQLVVHRVVQSSVDDFVVREVEPVVDADRPEVDGDEQREEEATVDGEEHDVEVVGQALDVAVDRVEGVRGERRADNPLVVRLVQRRVDEWVVQPAVEPVDQHVGEHDEPDHGHGLERVAVLTELLICLGVATDVREEPREGEHDHNGD
ncbi:unnamed protein product [Phytophthora lilii]|uniref:Unnamed protein product n=1 Tax=Phytophthora lilii TaxID=2077276 RepID=A0A9W6TBP2_9STRA|nr:unnamed protein product [Phytophthora lilii]